MCPSTWSIWISAAPSWSCSHNKGVTVDPAPQTEHLGYRMMALEVDDMEKTADYLRTKGVDIVWGPRVRETYSRAEICDPNGYHIELRQWFR